LPALAYRRTLVSGAQDDMSMPLTLDCFARQSATLMIARNYQPLKGIPPRSRGCARGVL
jgi:hypothetical protein